jgi:FtsH-binding integral membrane protein
MSETENIERNDKLLRVLFACYIGASLLHFSHNAEFLNSYPNLPHWITRTNIYVIWAAISLVGCLGFLLYERRRAAMGVALLVPYAALGLDGLLHYTRAPFTAHSAAMNLTILLEAGTAMALLAATLVAGINLRRDQRMRRVSPLH